MGASITRLPFDAPRKKVGDVLLDEGAVIVEGVLNKNALAEFNAEIDVLSQHETPEAERKYFNTTVASFFGEHTAHVAGLAGKSAVFRREVLCHELYVAMCDRVLRPMCATYQLNFADVMIRGPGSKAQVLHRDDGVWPYFPRPSPQIEFASMTALSEFTADMGATIIVPGSHLWPDRNRQPKPEECAVAEMEPGSSALYLGSTMHGAGANATQSKWRRGMHLSYCLGWLRPVDNTYLTAPVSLVRTLPREQQAMLGYAIHDAICDGGGFVGAVDWRDPLDLLAEGKL